MVQGRALVRFASSNDVHCLEIESNPLLLNDICRFFDNYVIPLARKLKECGVFGAASEECLRYAISNRKEWEAKGEDIVAQYLARLRGK